MRAGDVLRLRVWREPEWSGEFPVATTGEVILPRLGATRVDTMTLPALKALLELRFGAFLREPIIEMTAMRRVGLFGAVLRPGVYLADPTMGPADVLNLAGGLTPEARRDYITLEHAGVARRIDLRSDRTLGDRSLLVLQSGDRVIVPEQGWVSQNFRWIVPLAGTLASAVILSRTR